MYSSFQKRRRPLFAVILLIFLTGCTTASDWISGPVAHPDPAIAYPRQLDQIQIGVTTKEQVRNALGNPRGIVSSAGQDDTRESWSYVKANSSVHPIQYVPFVGLYVDSKKKYQTSFSISFSANGVVEGVSLREVQPYGEETSSPIIIDTTYETQPYGTYNPQTRHGEKPPPL